MAKRTNKRKNRAFTSVMAMMFVTLFTILAISLAAMSTTNVQMAQNHYGMAQAQVAAESGLQYAMLLIEDYDPPAAAWSPRNTVTQTEAEDTFGYFVSHVQTFLADSPLLNGAGTSYDSCTQTLQVPATGNISLNGNNNGFSLLFEFIPGTGSDPHIITVTSTGNNGNIERGVQITFPIRKNSEILEYAIASRGRMWITGDSTIEGDVFSSWDRPEISPYNMTADSKVLGTVNTVLSRENIEDYHYGYDSYQMETLDADGNPIYDEDGDRVVSPEDELQGEHEGVNYDQPYENMPGMDISDYDTDDYNNSLTTIPSSSQTEVEFFPHKPGYYDYPKTGTPTSTSCRKLYRHVYENQTFTDTLLPDNRNALFRNCTFNGKFYVDCYKSGSTGYNNVRFEDCTFNGPIITDVPQIFKWMYNTLYFTGTADFNNTDMAEATILAPHFNVNLGNTAEVEVGGGSELTGAIVGGIVDVRGNASIKGTIISMCDTTQWSSGYVTNIGFASDGGSESSALDPEDDVGVITINPDPEKMLPSGIKTPIVIGDAYGNTYVEL